MYTNAGAKRVSNQFIMPERFDPLPHTASTTAIYILVHNHAPNWETLHAAHTAIYVPIFAALYPAYIHTLYISTQTRAQCM